MPRKQQTIKEHFVSLRVTEEEKTVLKAKAKEFGYSLSDYILSAVANRHMKSRNADVKEALKELNRIGSNVNQMAKKWNSMSGNLHSFDKDKDVKEIIELLSKLRETLQ